MKNELELIDTKKNKFMNLRKGIKKEEYEQNIGEYIVIRYKDNDKELEITTKLVSVTDDSIEIISNKENVLVKISDIKEGEILKLSDEVKEKLSALEVKEKVYLVDLTNIYDETIRCMYTYHGELNDVLEGELTYKFQVGTQVIVEKTTYNVALIKDIKIADEINMKEAVGIINNVAKYYDIKLEELFASNTNPEKNRYTNLVICLYYFGKLNEDKLCYVLDVNRNFIDFVVSISYMYEKDDLTNTYENIKAFLDTNKDLKILNENE